MVPNPLLMLMAVISCHPHVAKHNCLSSGFTCSHLLAIPPDSLTLPCCLHWVPLTPSFASQVLPSPVLALSPLSIPGSVLVPLAWGFTSTARTCLWLPGSRLQLPCTELQAP